MPNKSCGDCKRCTRIIRQHDESKNIYLCYQYYCNGDACELWEGRDERYKFSENRSDDLQ